MAAHARVNSTVSPPNRTRGQALVELAMVMPIMVGMVAVLFQFAILFVAYLSIVQETRDIGRYVAVHPDTKDGTCASGDGLWGQVCDDAPSVVDKTKLTPSFTPACASLNGSVCAGRTAGSQIEISLSYDAGSIIFLPIDFRLGPWLRVAIPAGLPRYDYFVMVEQH